MSSENGRFVTQDFAVAKYLHAFGKDHGVLLRSAKRLPGPARHEFSFDDPDGRAHSMAVEFANSDCRPYDNAGQSLKTMLAISDGQRAPSHRKRRRRQRGDNAALAEARDTRPG